MRRVVILLLLTLTVGCGSGFRDEDEELSYLQSQQNPTPSQWKRKNELTLKKSDKIDKLVQMEVDKYEAGQRKTKTDKP